LSEAAAKEFLPFFLPGTNQLRATAQLLVGKSEQSLRLGLPFAVDQERTSPDRRYRPQLDSVPDRFVRIQSADGVAIFVEPKSDATCKLDLSGENFVLTDRVRSAWARPNRLGSERVHPS
jgi:hypothetical protein